MLKIWYEKRPFTFGSVFIFFFMTIPILDRVFIYPTMKPQCNKQIGECDNWIHNKETNHVRTTKRGSGGLHRNTPSNEYLQEQERAITDFGRKPNHGKGLEKDY